MSYILETEAETLTLERKSPITDLEIILENLRGIVSIDDWELHAMNLAIQFLSKNLFIEIQSATILSPDDKIVAVIYDKDGKPVKAVLGTVHSFTNRGYLDIRHFHNPTWIARLSLFREDKNARFFIYFDES